MLRASRRRAELPANTVGGDFFDISLEDGRRSGGRRRRGEGSPAALLMALLLAMMRTLVDERLEPADAVQGPQRRRCAGTRRAPVSSRCSTACTMRDPVSWSVRERRPHAAVGVANAVYCLSDGGMALGTSTSPSTSPDARSSSGRTAAVYSDGITEAENPKGQPFDDIGKPRTALVANRHSDISAIGAAVVRAGHMADVRFADDLTILLLRRTHCTEPVGQDASRRQPVACVLALSAAPVGLRGSAVVHVADDGVRDFLNQLEEAVRSGLTSRYMILAADTADHHRAAASPTPKNAERLTCGHPGARPPGSDRAVRAACAIRLTCSSTSSSVARPRSVVAARRRSRLYGTGRGESTSSAG